MNGTVTISTKLLMVLCTLGIGGLAMLAVALVDFRGSFRWLTAGRHPSQAQAVDEELDAAWDVELTAGVHRDTLRLLRRAAVLVRLERLGAEDSLLLHELTRVDAAADELGSRLMGELLDHDAPHVLARVDRYTHPAVAS